MRSQHDTLDNFRLLTVQCFKTRPKVKLSASLTDNNYIITHQQHNT